MAAKQVCPFGFYLYFRQQSRVLLLSLLPSSSIEPLRLDTFTGFAFLEIILNRRRRYSCNFEHLLQSQSQNCVPEISVFSCAFKLFVRGPESHENARHVLPGFPFPLPSKCSTRETCNPQCRKYFFALLCFIYIVRIFKHKLIHVVGCLHTEINLS